jgi:quinol monooxygenase YgiN
VARCLEISVVQLGEQEGALAMKNRSSRMKAVASLVAIVGTSFHCRPAAAAPDKETDMVVEYIRYEVPALRHEEFLAAYKAAGKELEASTRCVSFEVSQGVEDPNNFTVRIEWDSVEGHEKGFRGSPLFGSFFAKVKPFFSVIKEMKHYRVAARGRGAAPR